jgi:hypothetical protein
MIIVVDLVLVSEIKNEIGNQNRRILKLKKLNKFLNINDVLKCMKNNKNRKNV